jgi:hypothetical protein
MSTNTMTTGIPPATPVEPIGDKCRESKTPGELNAEYQELDHQITIKLEKYVRQAVKARNQFDELMPLLDRMQAMLSKRGTMRELMDTLGLPTWSEWFKEFRPRLKEDVTIRTIQRKLQEYRGNKPIKRKRQGYDSVDILHYKNVAMAAQQLAEADVDNPAYNPIREAINKKPQEGLFVDVDLPTNGISTITATHSGVPTSAAVTYEDWERYQLTATAPVYKRKYFVEASSDFIDRFAYSMSGSAFKKLLLMLREKPEQVLANAQDFAQLAVVLRGAAYNLNLLAAAITNSPAPSPQPLPKPTPAESSTSQEATSPRQGEIHPTPVIL